MGEHLQEHYASPGTTLGPHPLPLLRPVLSAQRLDSLKQLKERRYSQPPRVASLVVGRQRPYAEIGVTFVAIEDEYGMVSVVAWRGRR